MANYGVAREKIFLGFRAAEWIFGMPCFFFCFVLGSVPTLHSGMGTEYTHDTVGVQEGWWALEGELGVFLPYTYRLYGVSFCRGKSPVPRNPHLRATRKQVSKFPVWADFCICC